MLMKVNAGQVDVTLIGLGIKEALQAEKIPTIKVQKITSTFWEHLEINMDDPILSDLKVRQALAYGIDYQDLNNRVFFGQRKWSPYPYIAIFNEYYRNPKAVLPSTDINKAKQLLDEAGWKVWV